MARLMALPMLLRVLAFFSVAKCVTSANVSQCSGELCEAVDDDTGLFQKRYEVSNERTLSFDNLDEEGQTQSGANVSNADRTFYDLKDYGQTVMDCAEIVRSGRRPAIQKMNQIQTMLEEMKTELITTHNEAVTSLQSLSNGTLDAPKSVSKTNRDALQVQKTIKTDYEDKVVKAESDHDTCRGMEATKKREKEEKCSALATFVSNISPPHMTLPTSQTTEAMGSYLQDMSNYFAPPEKVVTCTEDTVGQKTETLYDQFNMLVQPCTNATEAYDEKRAECRAYQKQYESHFCEWKDKVTDTCASYQEAYDNAVAAYTVKEQATKALAGTAEEQEQGKSTWKTEYAGLTKMACYALVWMTDSNANTTDAEKLKECDETVVDTSPMDVTYPGVACKKACSTTAVDNYPGTEGFAAGYAKFGQEVDAVTHCVGADASSDDDAEDGSSDEEDVSSGEDGSSDAEDESADGEDAGGEASCNKVVTNPAEEERTYSSVYANQAKGTGHARSMLNSPQAWSAATNTAGEWMSMDLGRVRKVWGVITQGRADDDQYVKTFKVKYSEDETTWKEMPSTFTAGSDSQYIHMPSKESAFPQGPVLARYVKLVVQTWHGHISMRAAALTCEATTLMALTTEAPYILGAASTNTCPKGYTVILDEGVCQAAVASLGIVWQSSGAWGTQAKGCIKANGNYGYLNRHATGAAKPTTSPICTEAKSAAKKEEAEKKIAEKALEVPPTCFEENYDDF